MQSCSLRNISCVSLVRGVLDFGQSSRVTVAVWGCQQELQCCHLLEVVGWGGVYTAEKQILHQLPFMNLYIYSSLGSQYNIVQVYACD